MTTQAERLSALVTNTEEEDFVLYALKSFIGEYLREPTDWDDTPTRRRCAKAIARRI
jgi:hypothetical protein